MRIPGFYTILMMLATLSAATSCKKEYVRPDHYAVDLFQNEKNEQKKRVLSHEEAAEKSLIVIKSNETELLSTPVINKKAVYIYKINAGRLMKTDKDSIVFPVRIISGQDLKLGSAKSDSLFMYLIKPGSYKLLVDDFGVRYQILPSSPVR